MKKPIIDCIAFLLIKGNKILLEKRKLTKKVDPGKICIPSGGTEKGETPEEATLREIKEEFDIEGKNPKFIAKIIYPTEKINFLVSYYVIKEWEGKIQNLEADRLEWVEISKDNVDTWIDKIAIDIYKNVKS